MSEGIALRTCLMHEYGIRYPFVGAGMGFIAHERLAAAVTNAGAMGVLGKDQHADFQ
jgi:NAD(P)H-dependent flavin oxidoreductase YrpB (nitropropane dioxygenase family)